MSQATTTEVTFTVEINVAQNPATQTLWAQKSTWLIEDMALKELADTREREGRASGPIRPVRLIKTTVVTEVVEA